MGREIEGSYASGGGGDAGTPTALADNTTARNNPSR